MKNPSRTSASRILREVSHYRLEIGIGFILMFIATPLSLFHPFVWKFVVDDVLIGKKYNLLIPALVIMVVVHGINIIVGAVRDYFLNKAGEKFTRDLRNRLYQKISRQSLNYMHNQRSGDIMARVISDVDTMQTSIITGISNLLMELLTFILVLGSVIYINWKVGMVTIVPLAIAYLIVRIFNVRVKHIYSQAREYLGQVSARLQENISGFHLIKTFNRENEELGNFKKATEKNYKKSMEAVRMRTYIFPSVFFVGFITNVIMLGMGAWFVMKGEFTIGGLIAYRAFWWQLNAPVITIAQVNDLLQRALASSQRVYEVLDAPLEMPDAMNAQSLDSFNQGIKLIEMGFHYANGKEVFTGLNTEIKKGEWVALAGPSGIGKSTLLNLMMRFYDPTSGSIMIDDLSIIDIKKDSLRKHMGMVLQDTFLFNDNILDNIRYCRPEMTKEEVIVAAKQANAHDFILGLPDGYETAIGERGVKLSGGQRQRISVARLFLVNPEIVLLDEPTSSVEPESEAIIQKSLEELMRGRTVILSSHKISLLKKVNRIIYIDKGQIVQEGSHEELFRRGGAYAQMYGEV